MLTASTGVLHKKLHVREGMQTCATAQARAPGGPGVPLHFSSARPTHCVAAALSWHWAQREAARAAQERLSKARVLVVGAGGLGCPCALHLVASGVGTLGIVDKDVVSLDNLHRQIAHAHSRIGMHKADSAAEACRQLDPDATLQLLRGGLTAANAADTCGRFDVVVDCSDNAPTRYIVNDACVATARPLVSGAAVGMEGQLTVYNHKGGPCYRCVHGLPLPATKLTSVTKLGNRAALNALHEPSIEIQQSDCVRLCGSCRHKQ